jgi:hypothetical protein
MRDDEPTDETGGAGLNPASLHGPGGGDTGRPEAVSEQAEPVTDVTVLGGACGALGLQHRSMGDRIVRCYGGMNTRVVIVGMPPIDRSQQKEPDQGKRERRKDQT